MIDPAVTGGPAIVADTNVLIYAATDEPTFGPQASAVLVAAGTVHVPASAPAEAVQTLWRLLKVGAFPPGEMTARLARIASVIDHLAPVIPLWDRAAELAQQHDHSPYDTLFVALAEREGLRVVTFDRTLARKFPTHCVEPAAFLAGPPVPPPSPRP